MTYTEIVEMLTGTEIPFTYYSWPEKEAPQLPYICYYYPSSDNEPADNKVHKRIENLTIELYTDYKDFALEEALQDILDENSIVWERDEEYITNEHMFMITYSTQVVIDHTVPDEEVENTEEI